VSAAFNPGAPLDTAFFADYAATVAAIESLARRRSVDLWTAPRQIRQSGRAQASEGRGADVSCVLGTAVARSAKKLSLVRATAAARRRAPPPPASRSCARWRLLEGGPGGAACGALFPGQRVWVRPKAAHEWRLSRAWVVASAEAGAEARADAARVSVECLAEGRQASRCVRVGELIVIVDGGAGAGTDVMVCPDTDTFRRLANAQVQPGDKVLEIGASLGETTARLARAAHGAEDQWGPGSVVAIDITDTLFARARARCDEVAPDAASIVRFLKMDALADKLGLLRVAEDTDAIFLDIGGDRSGDTVALLLALLLDRTAPRLIVVKSEELARELRAAATTPAAGEQAPLVALLAHGLLEGAHEWFAARCQAAEQRAAEDRAAAPPQGACGSVSTVTSSSNDSDGTSGVPDEARTRYRKNPLKQPRRTVAETGLEVCRFYNYHTCLKGDSCPFDHSHCHLCGQAGHTAHLCTEYALSVTRAGASDASEAARVAR
jgi:hypothetical protein